MLISHEDIPQVSQEFMNNTHKEDVELINALFEEILAFKNVKDNTEKIDKMYQEWIEHTVEHFQNEEIKMQEMRFPPYLAHKGEHNRALQEMPISFLPGNKKEI